MGYAKLNFATSVTTGQALFDIVRVINGTITSAANLSHASTTNSEIVNTLAQNWTVTYGTVANTTTAYVLENGCVTAGKTKYAWLLGKNSNTYAGTTVAFTGSGSGLFLNTITAATSATSVSNPGYYNGDTVSSNHFNYSLAVDGTNNNNIYVSWSKYHLALYGWWRTGGTGLVGTFEYPETSLSQFTNTPPVVQYMYKQNSSNTWQTTVGGPSGGDATSPIFQATNIHFPTTSITSGIVSIAQDLGTINLDDWSPIQTYDSTGAQVYPLVPIYDLDPQDGIPIINISELTGVYRMASGAGPFETIYTVGADSYVWLPIATNINSTTSIDAGIAFLKK